MATVAKHWRFSLRHWFIALTAGATICFFGYRYLVGTSAEHATARRVAEQVIIDHPGYEKLIPEKSRVASLAPRGYLVYGKADGVSVRIYVYRSAEGEYVSDGTLHVN